VLVEVHMENSRRQGRLVGVFVIVQLVLLIVPYVMLAPGVTADYVTAAAEMSATIKTAVFLLFGTGAVTLAIAITAYPAFRERSLQWSLWLVAISIVWFVMQCVDNAYVMSMVSLSRRFAENTGANSGLYDLIAAQTRSSRMWVHYTGLLVYDIWFTSFYGILLRFTLVPRIISLIGLRRPAASCCDTAANVLWLPGYSTARSFACRESCTRRRAVDSQGS